MTEDFSTYRFAETFEEAEQRFIQFRRQDPLPDVPPALLNYADIYDYARITSMVHPFEHTARLKQKLKLASYEIDFIGEVYEINDHGEYVDPKIIEHGTRFELRRNSIAFVYLKTAFFLPHYIGVRFNLRIRHVHRGLLLGTGPLVDPGFCGRLLVPLHNLTSEKYVLMGGEGFIWAEFTKLSPKRCALPESLQDKEETFDLTDKTNLSALDFFQKASQGTPASSSMAGITILAEEAKETADGAEKTANRILRWGLIIGGVALLSLLAGLVMVVFHTWSLITDTNEKVITLRESVQIDQQTVRERLQSIEKDVEKLETSPNNSGTSPSAGKER